MRYFSLVLIIIAFGCSTKYFEVNGLVCPSNHTEQMVQNDLSSCHYYDEKAIAESSKSPISPDCKKCLEKKGYKIKE